MNAAVTALLHTRAISPAELWTPAAWPRDWTAWLGIVVAAVGYTVGTRALWQSAGRGRGIAVWRTRAFGAGLGVLVLALCTPIATVSASLFSWHMVQHLLLVQFAAPLLILGLPSVAFAWALPPRARRALPRAVNSGALRTVRRVSTHWLVAWTVHAVAIVAWHLPPWFQLALRSDVAHAAQHISFLGTALLFWSATGVTHLRTERRVVHSAQQRARRGRRPLTHTARFSQLVGALGVFATGIYGAVLGAMLALTDTLAYRDYARRAIAWGVTPLDDQHLAGTIMWLGGGIVSLVSALLLFRALLADTSGARPSAA